MMDILIPEELAASGLDLLKQKYAVLYEPGLWRQADRLRDAVRGTRALLVRNQTQVTAELLEAGSMLVAVGRLGVGLDNIDLAAASKRGVVVIAPLDANATSVAELAVGLMLGLARKIPMADRSTKAGGWDRKGCMGIELAGKALAICGFGRIGRLVAVRARAFGMKIAVFDPYATRASTGSLGLEVEWDSVLEEALSRADFVSVHVPLTARTHRMFDGTRFSQMKRGSFFINTSRGGLVDERALFDALRTGHLGGAALDVREFEPPETQIGFEQMANVILTPHIGAATHEAQTRTFQTVVEDIERILRGERAVNEARLEHAG